MFPNIPSTHTEKMVSVLVQSMHCIPRSFHIFAACDGVVAKDQTKILKGRKFNSRQKLNCQTYEWNKYQLINHFNYYSHFHSAQNQWRDIKDQYDDDPQSTFWQEPCFLIIGKREAEEAYLHLRRSISQETAVLFFVSFFPFNSKRFSVPVVLSIENVRHPMYLWTVKMFGIQCISEQSRCLVSHASLNSKNVWYPMYLWTVKMFGIWCISEQSRCLVSHASLYSKNVWYPMYLWTVKMFGIPCISEQ